jgi:SWI/SNF-related matrix-associated actin-dependent regulator of chromatin subfamily A3
MSGGKRDSTLKAFASDPNVRAILVSISCGGQGYTLDTVSFSISSMANNVNARLDLTIANRAYLLEPQWNPMLEEQALSRVHRIGQERPVTTIRLVMKNTFEENVIATQERKKHLVDLTVERGRLKDGNAGRQQLHVCTTLLYNSCHGANVL